MHQRTVVAILACALLLTPAGALASTADQTTIGDIEVGGPGFAVVEDNKTFVWQTENATINVTVNTGDLSESNHEVCVRAPELENGQRELGCEHRQLESNATTTFSVPVSTWPDDAVDSSLTLEVTLSEALTGTRVAEANTSVTVVAKDGQFDGDQLSNQREVELGTKLSAQDTDGDGLWDGQEVNEVGSSPLEKDTDDDGVPDAVEVNYGTNTTLADTDGDGLSDDAEINEYSTDPLDEDTDDDGLADGREVHELDSSPTDADTDDDGLDDPTELELGTDIDDPDSDDDGLTDGEEINQYDTNPLEADTDGDGVSDGREVEQLGTNPRVEDADSDGDLLSDGLEFQIGTDPGSALSPWGYVVVLLGAGVIVGTQVYRVGWRVRRTRWDVWGRTVTLPTVTRVRERREATAARRSDSRQRTDAEPPSGRDAGPAERAAAATSSTDGVDALGASGARTNADDAGSTPEQSAGATDGADTQSGQTDIPEQAFLTDADRVTELLREAGGNCRQQDIVRETGWSKSKVSRLLSQMEEDDEIRKISLGRENVIVLPGEEPDAVRSALDDE